MIRTTGVFAGSTVSKLFNGIAAAKETTNSFGQTHFASRFSISIVDFGGTATNKTSALQIASSGNITDANVVFFNYRLNSQLVRITDYKIINAYPSAQQSFEQDDTDITHPNNSECLIAQDIH